jgi:hypothetical protein
MRKILMAVFLSLGLSGALFADDFSDMTNQLSQVMGTAVSPISIEMAKHMGFYTGSGNITPVNTAGWFSLKLGAGIGLNLSSPFLNYWNTKTNPFTNTSTNPMSSLFNDAGTAIAMVPFPYDLVYAKLGIPVLPMDIGFRFGIIPPWTFSDPSGSSVSFFGLHLGAEGRYVLWEILGGLLKVDARLSMDYNNGYVKGSYTKIDTAYVNSVVVGTNTLTIGVDYEWGGLSVGTKLMGGLNIPFIGGIYGGLGLNVNFGAVTTTLTGTGRFSPVIGSEQSFSLSGPASQGYNFLDLRLIGGFQLLFINAAVEYGLLNGDLAVTIVPISLAF